MQSLLELLNDSALLRMFAGFGLAVATFLILSRLPPYRRIFLRIFRLFLYDEDRGPAPSYPNRDVETLRDRIRRLEKAIASRDEVVVAEERVSAFLEDHLKDMVETRLAESEVVEGSVIAELKRSVSGATHEYLTGRAPEELEAAYAESARIETAVDAMRRLEDDLGRERGSAATLRTVMINLFVVFNLGLLITYVSYGQQLEGPTLYTIGGSYLSLVAFIVYIVRASHFRTGVLLAIRESFVNQNVALSFLEGRASDGPLSESDVEVVRMLLVNRTEREARAEHPYEVVLRQVEGSNIQFKGGKISLGSKGEAK